MTVRAPGYDEATVDVNVVNKPYTEAQRVDVTLETEWEHDKDQGYNSINNVKKPAREEGDELSVRSAHTKIMVLL